MSYNNGKWRETKEQLNGLDNMWLIMADHTDFNPACAATYTFKGKLDIDTLKESYAKMADRFPRYKQKLVDLNDIWKGASFIDDPDFNIDLHTKSIRLTSKSGRHTVGRDELDEYVGHFIAQPWDLSRPLWESTIIENYEDEAGAHSAMVTRGHHSLTDGQGFVLSQMSVTSFGPKLEKMMADGQKSLQKLKSGTRAPSSLHPSLKPLDRFTGQWWMTIALATIYWSLWSLAMCIDLYWSVIQAVQSVAFWFFTFWRVTTVTPHYSGERVKEREFSTSTPFAMKDIKLLQKAFSGVRPGSIFDHIRGQKRHDRDWYRHVTLNDVVCAVISDVIAQEIAEKKPDPGIYNAFVRSVNRYLPNPVGIFIPISIREAGDWTMKNLSTGALAYLPSSYTEGKPRPDSLYDRIHATRRRLKVLKHSLLPRFNYWLNHRVGAVPILWPSPLSLVTPYGDSPLQRVTRLCLDTVMTSFCAIVTNVPGPSKERLEMCGQEVIRWTALPPQAGKGTLGIGIISYAGDLYISVSADKVKGGEGVARRLTDKFERRWREYLEAANKVIKN
ncbi:hypothetical protein PROFUN_04108 [Planoprotostelium fungivorum]|uniref:Uncharacterized protein n=1 Tax=Planoprotostelium fungivorum TaxID=1890364 RepID=A0A2P6NJJ6_9EUKA|nr:hypothetical protein PROFUN_04108 [Planoprotostelium fungivorum]